MRIEILAVLLLCIDVIGCGAERAQQGCRMEKEAVIYVMADVPTAIVLERLDEHRLITAWSAGKETRFMLLNNDGAAIEESVRVDRCPFVLAKVKAGDESKTFWPEEDRVSLDAEVLTLAIIDADTVVLGVLEQASASRRGGAYAVIIELAGTRGVHVIYLGEAGEFAAGMALATIGNSVYAAWHDGRADHSLVKTARIDIDNMKIEQISVIPGGRAAANPALAVEGKRLLIAWQETLLDGDSVGAEVKTAYLTVDLKLHNVNNVAKCKFMDTAPALTTIGKKFGLAYRDDADGDDRAEFYFVMIDASGNVVSSPTRISRADGYQGTNIDYDGKLVFSAQIRSFQRNFLVGMNRFNLKGVKEGSEFQIYADKSDFIRVALNTHGSTVLLVYGEDRYGTGRIFSGKVVCRNK